MDTVLYTSHSYGETTTVDAFNPAPGLYVYQLPEHLRHPDFPWLMGHSSGLVIAAFERKDHALAAIEVIADFADWTRTADDLRADVDALDLSDLIDYRTAGVFISADPARNAQVA